MGELKEGQSTLTHSYTHTTPSTTHSYTHSIHPHSCTHTTRSPDSLIHSHHSIHPHSLIHSLHPLTHSDTHAHSSQPDFASHLRLPSKLGCSVARPVLHHLIVIQAPPTRHWHVELLREDDVVKLAPQLRVVRVNEEDEPPSLSLSLSPLQLDHTSGLGRSGATKERVRVGVCYYYYSTTTPMMRNHTSPSSCVIDASLSASSSVYFFLCFFFWSESNLSCTIPHSSFASSSSSLAASYFSFAGSVG